MKKEALVQNTVNYEQIDSNVSSIIDNIRNNSFKLGWKLSIDKHIKEKNVRINSIVIGTIGVIEERIYIGSNSNIILVFGLNGDLIDEIELDSETEIKSLFITNVTEEYIGNNLIAVTTDNSINFYGISDNGKYKDLSASINERGKKVTAFFPLCNIESYDKKLLLLGYSSGEVKVTTYDDVRDDKPKRNIIQKDDIIEREEIKGICGSLNLLNNKIGIIVAYQCGVLLLYDENYQLIVKDDIDSNIEKLFFIDSEKVLVIITDEFDIIYFTISENGFQFKWKYRTDVLGSEIINDRNGGFYILFEDSGLIYNFTKTGKMLYCADPNINGTSGEMLNNDLFISSNEGDLVKYSLLPSEEINSSLEKLFDTYNSRFDSIISNDDFVVWFNDEFEQPDREPFFIEYLNNLIERNLFGKKIISNILFLFENEKYDTEIASGLIEKIRTSYVLKENFKKIFKNTIVEKEISGYKKETEIELDIENKADKILLDTPDAFLNYISLIEKLRVNKIDIIWQNQISEDDEVVDVTMFHDPFIENDNQILIATKKGKLALINKYTGLIIWSFNIPLEDGIIMNILVTDICNDGRMEIIVGLDNSINAILIITESNSKYDINKTNFSFQELDLLWDKSYTNTNKYKLFHAHCFSPGLANKTIHKVNSFDFDNDGVDDLIISSENGNFNVFYFDRDARQNIKTSKIQIFEHDDDNDDDEDVLDFCFIRNPDDSISVFTGSQTGKIEKHKLIGSKFEKENSLLTEERYGIEARITDLMVTEINNQNCILFSSEDNFVYCLYDNLKYKWSFKASGNIISLAIVNCEDSKYIFCASDDSIGNLIALDLYGNKIWDFPFYKPLQRIYAFDNKIVVADSDGSIYLAVINKTTDIVQKIDLKLNGNSIDFKSMLKDKDEFIRIFSIRKILEKSHLTESFLIEIRKRIDDRFEFTGSVRCEIIKLITESVFTSKNKKELLELIIKPILDKDNSEEVRLESTKSFITLFNLYILNNFDLEQILLLIVNDENEYVKAHISGELGKLFIDNLDNIEVNKLIWSCLKTLISNNIDEDWVVAEALNSTIKILNNSRDFQLITSILNDLFDSGIENDIYGKFKIKLYNEMAIILFDIYFYLFQNDIINLILNTKKLKINIENNGVKINDTDNSIPFLEIIDLSHCILIEDNLDEFIKDNYLNVLTEKHFNYLENLKGINHSLKEYSESTNSNERIRIISQILQEIKDYTEIKSTYRQSKFIENLLSLIIEQKIKTIVEENLKYLLEAVNIDVEIEDSVLFINQSACVNICFDVINNGFKKVDEIEINIKEDSHYKIIKKPDYTGDLIKGESKKVYFTVSPYITSGKVEIFVGITYKNCKQNILKKIQINVQEEEVKEWIDIPDIFKSGAPVVDDRIFVGRENQIKEIKNSIDKGESVFVMGHRRMGKTSLIYYILRNYLEKDKKYIPVFISAEKLSYTNTNDFLYSLFTIGSVFNSILIEEKIFEHKELEKKLRAIKKYGISEYNSLFNSILRLIKRQNRILVFVIDEYPMIHDKASNGFIDSAFLTNLRGYIQHNSEEFNMIFSGASSLKYIRSDYTSNIMGVGKCVEANFFNESEINTLISKPLNNLLKFDPTAFNFLVDLTCGHPYFTQRILDFLVKKINNQRSGYTVFKEDLEELLPSIIESTEYISSYWDRKADDKQKESTEVENMSEIIKSKDLKWNENDIKLATAYKHLIISYIADSWTINRNGIDYQTLILNIEKVIEGTNFNRMIFDEVLSILTVNDDILLLKNKLYFIKVGIFREWVINRNLTFEKVKNNINEQYLIGGQYE